MRPDTISGTAVLHGELLWVLCLSWQHRNYHIISLPVYRTHEVKKEEPSWTIDQQGTRLHVSPSVHITTSDCKDVPELANKTLFHNDGSWSVDFVTSRALISAESQYDQCYELNRSTIEQFRKELQKDAEKDVTKTESSGVEVAGAIGDKADDQGREACS